MAATKTSDKSTRGQDLKPPGVLNSLNPNVDAGAGRATLTLHRDQRGARVTGKPAEKKQNKQTEPIQSGIHTASLEILG